MKKISLVIIFIITIAFINPSALLATNSEGLGCGEGLGPLAKFFCEEVPSDIEGEQAGEIVGNRLNAVLSSVITFLTTVASLWFAIQFITAGLAWISAGGDKTKLEEAQKKIQNSLIGITVVVSAWVVLGVIGAMLGLQILNPGAILQSVVIE